MARQFLGLYLLIIMTLAVVSWGQDRLLQAYSSPDPAEEKPTAAVMSALTETLHRMPPADWKKALSDVSAKSGLDLELFASADIAGRGTLERLERGDIAYMQSAAGTSWMLKNLSPDYVLAIKSTGPAARRGPLEWCLTIAFYAAIALVVMIWLWPLTRDLRRLEHAAALFGNRNWRFEAHISPRSQIYPLAETFRRMALRIDGLIASHKDMSNAVSHEIKTPLSRMQFEIELLQQRDVSAEVRRSLANIKSDIVAIDDLVRATLDYAILERADLALNLNTHNFTTLIPAIAEYVKRDARPDLSISTDVQSDATAVVCDVHLFESVLKNLLYNASRYAKRQINVTFSCRAGTNQLIVDDDGPGIPPQERGRVFESFVQLDKPEGRKAGFGLGLAIVKRAIEWHDGKVEVSTSPLGGARVCATWPARTVRG